MPVIMKYCTIPNISIIMFPVKITGWKTNFRFINGAFTRFSTIIKIIRKIIPTTRGTTKLVKLVAIDPLNVIAIRKLTKVTVIVIIPIKSRRFLLGCFCALVGKSP